jgi:thiol-disulfide isomerase/thioredoxin
MSPDSVHAAPSAVVGCPFCGTLNRVSLGRLDDRPKCAECQKPLLLDRPVHATDDHLSKVISGATVPVLVDFYADWCAPCKSLEKNLGDPAMVAAFDGAYIIRLNLDDWKDRLPAAGFRVTGIPAFYELGADGKPTGRMVTGAAWGEDIPANMAPPLKAFFQTK